MQTRLFYFTLISMGALIAPKEDDAQSEVSQFSLDKHIDKQGDKKTGVLSSVLGTKQITGGPRVPVVVEQPELQSEPNTPSRSITLGGSSANAKSPKSPKSPSVIKVEISGPGVEEVVGAVDAAKVGCCGVKAK